MATAAAPTAPCTQMFPVREPAALVGVPVEVPPVVVLLLSPVLVSLGLSLVFVVSVLSPVLAGSAVERKGG